MQLDIFADSRDVMLRNDVVEALQRDDVPAARAAWRALCAEFPDDHALPALSTLIDALVARSTVPFADHATLADASAALSSIEPTADAMLAGAAGAWRARRWAELAALAAPLPFRSERVDDHAAPLWLRARDWPAAAAAVDSIESWRRIPAPLGWMAEARCRLDGADAHWPLLAELAWLAPARLDELVKTLRDPLLDALRKRFDASFESEADDDEPDLAWFPAWVLIEKPALARRLGEAQSSRGRPPERALRLLLDLLALERQGRQHDLVDRRKQLRRLQPSLFNAYIRTR